MPRQIDISSIRREATRSIALSEDRFRRFEASAPRLDDLRWLCCMTLVEFHTAWERFAERRLVAALNQNPSHFLQENSVRGLTRIPAGLAQVLARGGGKFFDFRSCSELIDKSAKLVSAANDPFRGIDASLRNHLDAMSSIRNVVVHASDSSKDAYKKKLRAVFSISSAPSVGEFLDSIDRRANSPLRGRKRVTMLGHVVSQACAQA